MEVTKNQRKICPEEALLIYENIHKWWMQDGIVESS